MEEKAKETVPQDNVQQETLQQVDPGAAAVGMAPDDGVAGAASVGATGGGWKKFVSPRIIVGVALAIGLILMFSMVLGWFQKKPTPEHEVAGNSHAPAKTQQHALPTPKPSSHDAPATSGVHGAAPSSGHGTPSSDGHGAAPSPSSGHGTPAPSSGHGTPAASSGHGAAAGGGHGAAASGHGVSSGGAKGSAFIDGMCERLDHELKRFWGWRVNDLIKFTDNVNMMQRGVIEVTRRTSEVLTYRIARTGNTAPIDPDLEHAMTNFMISAEQYWLPRAEDKYRSAIKHLQSYKERVENEEAIFYTREDNLLPLLEKYQELLGGCVDNLAKPHEEDGSHVSFFKADDYIYYTKGITMTILTIMEAIREDFKESINRHQAMGVIDHAIVYLEEAAEVDPWIVLESNFNSVLANHRANMSAPTGHAHFYVGLLIKALAIESK